MKIQINQLSKVYALLLCFIISSVTNHSFGQDDDHEHDKSGIDLHENPMLGNCDFDIASELTQSDWNRAAKELGNILYLNPLVAALFECLVSLVLLHACSWKKTGSYFFLVTWRYT